MTKEKAINKIKSYLIDYLPIEDYEEAEEVIEALEQKSCEDAISREVVFETIDDCNSDGLKGIFCSYDDGERFKKYIKNLPSVTSTKCIATIKFSKEDMQELIDEKMKDIVVGHKKGKWINIDKTHSKCDQCGSIFEIVSANYCPNCGSFMMNEGEKQ